MGPQQARIGLLYVRVSVLDEEVEHGSPEQQTHMGHEIAKMLSERTGIQHIIRYVLIEEKGVSGGTTKRPKYQQLIELVVSGKVDFICSKEISRLSRSTRDFCDLMELCRKQGVAVHIRGLDLQPDTPIGQLMFQLLALLAEFERAMTIRRVKDSSRSATINNGKLNGGRLPKGLDYGDRAGYPVPNAKDLDQVIYLMKTFVETGSLKSTLQEAHRLEIRNKDGGAFSYTTLKSLLTNRLLIGKKLVLHGLQDEQQTDVDLPHGAVVPVDLFEEVQKQIRNLDGGRKNRGARRIYPLSGLLFAEDNSPFTVQSGTSRSGKVFYYYRNQKNDMRVDANELEVAIFKFLKNSFQSNKELEAIIKGLQKEKSGRLEVLNAQIHSITQELSGLEKQDKSLLADLRSRAGVDSKTKALVWLEQQITDSEARKQELSSKLEALRRELHHLDGAQAGAKAVRSALETTFHRLEKADPVRKRHFLRRVIKRIVLSSDNKATIFWSIPGSHNLEERGVVPGIDWWANLEPGQPNFPPLPPHQLQNIISIRTSSKYSNEVFLREHYIEKGLSAAQIAALSFSSKKTILKYLRHYEIDVRPADSQRNLIFGQRIQSGSIVANPRTAKLIQKIISERNTGRSYREIADRMNAINLLPSRCSKWHAASIRKVYLKNFAYPDLAPF